MSPVNRKPLRVAVVSRHELTRAGLIHMLAVDPSRSQVLDTSQDGQLGAYDVTVYDLAALLHHAEDDLRHLFGSGDPVVGLVPDGRDDLAQAARGMGVTVTVPTSVTTPDLLDALEAAAAGTGLHLQQGHRPDAVIKRYKLSEREMDILVGIGAGKRNAEIANELYLSINSIKTYIRTAYRKIGVSSRSQAVLWVATHAIDSAHRDAKSAPGDRPMRGVGTYDEDRPVPPEARRGETLHVVALSGSRGGTA